MQAAEILDAFADSEELPAEALAETRRRAPEMVPVLLDTLRRFVEKPVHDPLVPSPLFWAVHMLGELKVEEACPLVSRLLRLDPEILAAELGDAVPETVPRLMYNVFDGDLAQITAVIDDPAADALVRSGLFDTLAMLVRDGRADREAVSRYVAAVHDRLRAEAPEGIVWLGWIGLVTLVPLLEHEGLARALFADGVIEPEWMSLEDLERDLELAREEPMLAAEWLRLTPFGRIEEELKDWSFEPPDDEFEEEEYYEAVEPIRNPYRHVGRNDPCPCGSGQKYKRCHGKT